MHFLLFLIFYFTIGLHLCFFNNILSDISDIFFDMDSSYVYSVSETNNYLLILFDKHPLIYIVLRPFFSSV